MFQVPRYDATHELLIPIICFGFMRFFLTIRGTAINEVVERHASGWSVKANLKGSKEDGARRRLRDTLG
jgi:hypothetical protein